MSELKRDGTERERESGPFLPMRRNYDDPVPARVAGRKNRSIGTPCVRLYPSVHYGATCREQRMMAFPKAFPRSRSIGALGNALALANVMKAIRSRLIGVIRGCSAVAAVVSPRQDMTDSRIILSRNVECRLLLARGNKKPRSIRCSDLCRLSSRV